jgi:3-hydroxy acid dehydrogenase/malonic semialdehyde reductase
VAAVFQLRRVSYSTNRLLVAYTLGMNNLKNKRVLITGASSGIGRAMAFSMAHEGAELFLLARREEMLADVQREVLKMNHQLKVTLIVADVTSKELPEHLKKVCQEKIDILINNAGLALGREKVEESKMSDWETMIDVNITANFRMARTVLPWMIQNGGGDIINICSVAGFYTYQGGAVYCATKHAVHAFTRVLREETAGRNIRVMQISPGMVETEFSQVRFRGDEKAADAVYQKMEPLTGEDIARMMTFMLVQPRHVVMDEIITMPMAQGAPTTIVRSST